MLRFGAFSLSATVRRKPAVFIGPSRENTALTEFTIWPNHGENPPDLLTFVIDSLGS